MHGKRRIIVGGWLSGPEMIRIMRQPGSFCVGVVLCLGFLFPSSTGWAEQPVFRVVTANEAIDQRVGVRKTESSCLVFENRPPLVDPGLRVGSNGAFFLGDDEEISPGWSARSPYGVPYALYERPALGDPVFQGEIDSLCVEQKAKTRELSLEDVLASPTRILRGAGLPPQHVVLSFDDGPHDPFTALVLDMLARCGIKAHFFVMGSLVNQPKHAAAIRRYKEMGHIVGSHSYTHANLEKVDYRTARKEIVRGHLAVESALGEPTPFFRFPFGAGATSPQLRSILKEKGLVSMGWTMSSYDTVYPGTVKVLEHSLGAFLEHSESGAIFLAHDRKRATVRMLPTLLSYLVEQGYTFVVIRAGNKASNQSLALGEIQGL